MKFTDYLTRRIHPHARRSPHIDDMSRLLSFPNWPDVIESWPDLRDWLKQHNAQMDDYTTAERAWTSYKAFLKVEGFLGTCQNVPAPCAAFLEAYRP